jgi:hypothetical protein
MDPSMRLKPKEVRDFRLRLLRLQSFICPLCGTKIAEHEATLDHDHKTGHCRAVLHRSCNQVEGRVLSWLKRGRNPDPRDFMLRILKHWDGEYGHLPYHPNHLTDTEKKLRKLRRKLKSLKTERSKQKVRDLIRKLQEDV